jgi:hypothetical protein
MIAPAPVRLHHGDLVAATKNDRRSRDMGKREGMGKRELINLP